MRPRRLEKLERRQPQGKPSARSLRRRYALWGALEASADAESAGRPFSWWSAEPELSK
jgi:hypothetical protein